MDAWSSLFLSSNGVRAAAFTPESSHCHRGCGSPGLRAPGVSGLTLSQVVTLRPMLPPAVADRKPPSPVGKAPDGLSSLHGLPIPASTS